MLIRVKEAIIVQDTYGVNHELTPGDYEAVPKDRNSLVFLDQFTLDHYTQAVEDGKIEKREGGGIPQGTVSAS